MKFSCFNCVNYAVLYKINKIRAPGANLSICSIYLLKSAF